MGKHRLAKIYQGMSTKAKAGIVAGILGSTLVATTVVATAATASDTVSVGVTNVSQTELDFTGHGSYELQVVDLDLVKQVFHFKVGGTVKVTGLEAGTAYEWRVVQPGHWGPYTTAFTTAASGSAASLSPVVDSLVPGAIEANYGGSFSARKTLVGTVSLPAAGKYLISLNAEATPSAAYTAQVFPQFFVYNGVPNASWTNDEFNVGAGSLESPTAAELSGNDVVNSYYSGASIVTVEAATTLNVYAFGYASDTSQGTYQLNSVMVNTVKVG